MRIVDDAMPDFELFQAHILGPGFPWHYARATKEDHGPVNPWLMGWVHMVFDDDKWYSQSHSLFVKAITAAMINVLEPVKGIYRIRIVMNTITDRPYLNGPHVDFKFPHKTALLYVNDADGNTLVYNERWAAGGHGPLTIAREITPVANRMVLFDGLRLHTGTTPTTTGRRVVLNINYE